MGPFVVDQVCDNGSLQLKDLQGNPLDTKTNGSRVKLYRPQESAELNQSETYMLGMAWIFGYELIGLK